MYASVALTIDTPGIRQPLSYCVPVEYSLTLGDCVVVPFGTREAIGYVLELSESAPTEIEIEKIRDVTARVIGDGASLPIAVLQTAQWMARNYLADLGSVIRSIVPPAQAAQVVKRYALCEGWEAKLTEITTISHRQVIEMLASFNQKGEPAATEKELVAALGGVKIDSPLRLLKQREILTERWEIVPPRMGAKKVKAVRLLLNWDDAESTAFQKEEKSPAQSRVLRLLAQSGGGPLPLTQVYSEAQTTAAVIKKLVGEGALEEQVLLLRRRPYKAAGGAAVPPMLMREQAVAVDEIAKRLDTQKQNVCLLYGVTGSGKTEVYLRAIAETRRRQRRALVLVPEIALTAQVVDTFRARIGDRVAVLHSNLSDGERRDEWQRIARGEADVVVGARSAIFCPLENVGLIVVDEEHEGSYKQDTAPRYHARDVAIARAKATGATVILGSATPSVESYYKSQSGEWGFIPLRERALSRPLPSVEIVDMRVVWKEAGPLLFAPKLTELISDRLTKREQTILYLNRRGYSMFLLCRDCGYSTRCPNCEVSLTFHQRQNRVVCHHCNHEAKAPTLCPSCYGTKIRPFGIGTERVEEEVRKAFPDARVLRMDRDTTTEKDAHFKMLKTFRTGEADILIGTQMVAKGLDFAGVTLVGVISADTALNMPDFRASERAFQLLTQVEGRAGRGRKPGHVIVQTFNPEHESIAAAAEHDYETFYKREINFREELVYPPFSRLANIISQDENPKIAEERLRVLASLISRDDDQFGVFSLLGPAPCPLSRLKNRWRWHLLIKAKDPDALRTRLREAFSKLTPTERHGLSIDIDPFSLL
jgi:primosomal protein N' (replication factor Y) (superfamily II helicase)